MVVKTLNLKWKQLIILKIIKEECSEDFTLSDLRTKLESKQFKISVSTLIKNLDIFAALGFITKIKSFGVIYEKNTKVVMVEEPISIKELIR